MLSSGHEINAAFLTAPQQLWIHKPSPLHAVGPANILLEGGGGLKVSCLPEDLYGQVVAVREAETFFFGAIATEPMFV